jgi:hypothetical protein
MGQREFDVGNTAAVTLQPQAVGRAELLQVATAMLKTAGVLTTTHWHNQCFNV